MSDDLKARFRLLDSIEFPYAARPLERGPFPAGSAYVGPRKIGTATFALMVAAIALSLVFSAFRDVGGDSRLLKSEPGGSESPSTGTSGAGGVTVPNINGLTDQEAMLALQDLGLKWVAAYRPVEGVQLWHATSVDPAPGSSVEPGTVIKLVIATDDVTPLPAGAAESLACPEPERLEFGGPNARLMPGGSAYITVNIPGIKPNDELIQVSLEKHAQWYGVWHVVRDGSVVAVIDYPSLDGVACEGSA